MDLEIQRHPNLATAMSKSIELLCVTEVTPRIVDNWLKLFCQTIDKYRISENTYNHERLGFGAGRGKVV